jgi:hypothetical protein
VMVDGDWHQARLSYNFCPQGIMPSSRVPVSRVLVWLAPLSTETWRCILVPPSVASHHSA